MKKRETPVRAAGVGDEAVRAATGKGWREWFSMLDRAGARQMDHTAIAKYLRDTHRVPGWWTQMITVGYEQARGIRRKHQQPDGYSVSGSRTIAVPVARAFDAWSDEKTRGRWLGADGLGADGLGALTVRKATPGKSMRITWCDGKSDVEVNFWDKGPAKCQVAVEHSKLTSAAAGGRMKRFWAASLDRLRDMLESPSSAPSQRRPRPRLRSRTRSPI